MQTFSKWSSIDIYFGYVLNSMVWYEFPLLRRLVSLENDGLLNSTIW